MVSDMIESQRLVIIFICLLFNIGIYPIFKGDINLGMCHEIEMTTVYDEVNIGE